MLLSDQLTQEKQRNTTLQTESKSVAEQLRKAEIAYEQLVSVLVAVWIQFIVSVHSCCTVTEEINNRHTQHENIESCCNTLQRIGIAVSQLRTCCSHLT